MRSDLRSFPLAGASHAGHALARLTPPKKSGQEAELLGRLKDIVSIKVSGDYAAAFQRFQGAAAALEATHFEATTCGPLAIGLGNASAYEVGLTLHHTYGVPYLPASALKGLALRAALQNGMAEADLAELFGNTGQAGAVDFLDGWLLPNQGPNLQLDTITVHHPDYYGSGKEWPTDFDDPNPVTFLSVPVGLRFELAIVGRGDWAGLAADLLRWGLEHLGLGGKTNAGYGGFSCGEVMRPLSKKEQEEAEMKQQNAEATALAEKIRAELKNVKAFNTYGQKWLAEIAKLPLERRSAAVEAFIEQAKKFNEKDWAKKARKLLEDA